MSDASRVSLWDAMRAAVSLSVKAMEEVRALSRQPGPEGKQGPKGDPGRLPLVKDWGERVYYEGDVVRHDGSTYQALRDTGQAPPGSDWGVLALKGKDAAELTPRRTFDPSQTYARLSLVNYDGGSWIAVRDNPGTPGEGDGWQIMASRGKAGAPGPRGERGLQGPPGPAGPGVIAVEREGMTLMLTSSDGTVAAWDMTDFVREILDLARRARG